MCGGNGPWRRSPGSTGGGTRTICVLAVLVALASGYSAAPLRAQTTQRDGSITGVVRDESGGVLPGVTVVATAAGATAGTVVTSGEGRYSLVVPPGIYVVAAELPGFAPFSSNPVSVGQGGTATLDVTLRLPSYGDTLVVTGSRAPEALR